MEKTLHFIENKLLEYRECMMKPGQFQKYVCEIECHNNVTILTCKNKKGISKRTLKPLLLAEREGFEPSIPRSEYTRFPVVRLRPAQPSLRINSGLQIICFQDTLIVYSGNRKKSREIICFC